MAQHHRKFQRIGINFSVEFFRNSVDRALYQYQNGIAENCSATGMFIAVEQPFSKGSVFNLEFTLEHAIKVQARAIVRWVQRFAKHPGMGIEFILFNDAGKHELRRWLSAQEG